MLPHVGAEFIALYVGAAEVDCAILGALPAALRGAARKSAQTLAAQHPQPSAATVHRTLCVALASLGKPALRQQRRLQRFSAAATCVRAHREGIGTHTFDLVARRRLAFVVVDDAVCARRVRHRD